METVEKELLFGSMQQKTKIVLGIVFAIIGATLLLSIAFALIISLPLQKLCTKMWMLATLDTTALTEVYGRELFERLAWLS